VMNPGEFKSNADYISAKLFVESQGRCLGCRSAASLPSPTGIAKVLEKQMPRRYLSGGSRIPQSNGSSTNHSAAANVWSDDAP
jgi:hypothetical protein